MANIALLSNGFTPAEKLLFYLEEIFGGRISFESYEEQIVYINNHKGGWEIGFKDVPSEDLLVAIILVFETKLCYDGISELIFYYEHSKKREIKIEDVAGCLKKFGSISNALALRDRLQASK